MAQSNDKKMKHSSDKYFHDDIIFSILQKLPIKSLLRFMSVSKSWNSLITSSEFIAAYDHRHVRNKTSHILYMPDDIQRAWQVCTLIREIDEPPSYVSHSDSEDPPYAEHSDLGGPSYVKQSDLLLPFSGYKVVGTCDGLICLTKEYHHIYIWNPCVGGLKLIVPPSQTPSFPYNVKLGFGFQRRSNDYRVVRLIIHERNRLREVEIYSLSSDSWRRIEIIEPVEWLIHDASSSSSEVFFDGCIYWLGENTILRFDMEEEKFEKMAATPPLEKYTHVELAVANGFLVLLGMRSKISQYVHEWAWGKYKSASWTCVIYLCPVRLSMSGHVMVEAAREDRKLFAVDYRGGHGFRVRDLGVISNVYEKFHLVRMVGESLVLLDQRDKNGYGFANIMQD